VIGVLLGSQVPASWGLGFAGTLAILCIMLPLMMNHAAIVGVLVASVVALLAFAMPYKLGLLIAVIAGMGAAMLVDEWRESRRDRHDREGKR
jgi:predicted branched-subunit amino acid permease